MNKVIARIEVEIPGGSNHYVDPGVLFKAIAKALQDQTLTGGISTIVQDDEGRVYLNHELVFLPQHLKPKPQPQRIMIHDPLLAEGEALGAIIFPIEKRR